MQYSMTFWVSSKAVYHANQACIAQIRERGPDIDPCTVPRSVYKVPRSLQRVRAYAEVLSEWSRMSHTPGCKMTSRMGSPMISWL